MAQAPNTPSKTNTNAANAAKNTPVNNSFWKNDFPLIRKPSIVLGTCIVIALLMVIGSRFFLGQQQEKSKQALIELAQAQEKYNIANTEQNNIRDFRQRYLDLVETGFVGEEKRLDVIELIRAIQESRKLLPINYDILPQQVVTIDPATFTSELDLNASKLNIRMGLLHELDLIHFIQDLKSKMSVIPQTCFLKNSEVFDASLLSANLEVECTLVLLTMNRRVGVEVPAEEVIE